MIHKTKKKEYRYKALPFPKGFLWGAGTSAHQVEGGNDNNDWWRFEMKRKKSLRSGNACDQYRLYKKDFALVKDLGHTAHRLSLEWSRIEPEQGVWDEEAIEHYRKVLQELKNKGIHICLTIHHFTNPVWLDATAWERASIARMFERYVEKVAEEYKDLVDMWVTINEPSVFMYQGWNVGAWPPGKKVSYLKQLKILWNIAQSHKAAYAAIKRHSDAPVGIANNCQSYDAYDRASFRSVIGTWALWGVNDRLFYFLSGRDTHDFLGINYYFHHRVVRKGTFKLQFLDPIDEGREKNDLGWELYPDGLFDVIMGLNHYKKPIYITECGVATESEHVRQRFLVNVLKQVSHAAGAGADMRGFFYWSLMDNFEWADGLGPRFGLVEVDFDTQKRKVRDTAYLYKKIITENQIHQELFRYFGYQTEFDPKTGMIR